MRLLYLTIKEFDNSSTDGVVKKIKYQINAFRKNGFDVDLTYIMLNENAVYFESEKSKKIIGHYKSNSGIYSKIIIAKFLKEHLKTQNYDGVYIRYLGGRTDPWHLNILKILKKFGIKTVLEIPTFPYDGEKSGMELWVDKLFRNNLKKYVKMIATYSDDDNIYGIDTIRIRNGIEVDSVAEIQKKDSSEEIINMIAVASFEKAHGYERIIKAVADYYDKYDMPKPIVHMVGDGADSNLYKSLTKEYGLEDKVIFYGRKSGKELDDVYNIADIALGSFGAYKKNIYKSSALKIREYLAKGLPIVSGVTEDVFIDNPSGFCLIFPNDASDVNLKKIVDWYEELVRENGIKLSEEIRSFAYDTIDVSVTMKPVTDYFLKG